jgi:hypothetical protein
LRLNAGVLARATGVLFSLWHAKSRAELIALKATANGGKEIRCEPCSSAVEIA